jgi:Tol biopolymer transport system component
VTAVVVVAAATSASGASSVSIARVSVNSNGDQSARDSFAPSISENGRYVVFQSDAPNLVAGDSNASSDIFVRDLSSFETLRASVRGNGVQAKGGSWHGVVSSDGRRVAFDSVASNLVSGDSNGVSDVFVRNFRNRVTKRASTGNGYRQSNGDSYSPSISDDGYRVAFNSYATDLMAHDTNGYSDVFVRNFSTNNTIRTSVSSSGAQANGGSYAAAVSGDGRVVAFESYASNLVAGDTNASYDVFIHNLSTGRTVRVSTRTNGHQGNGDSDSPSVSADGSLVAYASHAGNLVLKDSNAAQDVFVHDMRTGRTTRVSVSSAGAQGHGASFAPSISPDGTQVAFWSYASNLVPGDKNGAADVFVHDLISGQTTRVSLTSEGGQPNGPSYSPAVSGDDSAVVFESTASNLLPGDTNGARDIFLRDLSP